MKNPRLLFWLIILLTIVAIFINLPSTVSFNPNFVTEKLGIGKTLEFRQGLDLKGGVNLTFRADISDLSETERDKAMESARGVIERRINLFGVSEPLIQTAKVNNDYRIIVELPGVTNVGDAINLIGQTAKLSFWETTASVSAEIATSSAYPINASLVGPIKQTHHVVFDQSDWF